MIYYIEGKFNPTQEKVIIKTLEVLRDHLPKAYQKNITLSIQPTKRDDKVDGWCDEGDYTDWAIGVDRRLSCTEMFFTLAHELCHLEQFLTKRLVINSAGYYWEGKHWPYADLKETSYTQRPWEVEAINFEQQVENLVDMVVRPAYIKPVTKEKTDGVSNHSQPVSTVYLCS